MQASKIEASKVQVKDTRYYQIINMYYKMALYISSGCTKFQNEKAELLQSNPESLGQVWQIVRVEAAFEIVHTRSTLVLTRLNQNQIRLRFGEQKVNQLLHLKQVKQHENPNVYYFVSAENSGWRLYYEKVLKIGPFSQEDSRSQWQIVQCNINPIINRTCYFQNAYSTCVIDVPKASLDQGVSLIEYQFNNRFNQRFNLYKISHNTYQIGNINSKLFITASKKMKQGDQITQQTPTHLGNQQWVLEYQGRDLYHIRLALKPDMMIGIKDKQMGWLSYLVLTANEEMGLWKIVGCVPHWVEQTEDKRGI